MWSSLKSHFGCSYKEISVEQFTETLSLAARVPLEGEYIGKETLPMVSAQFTDEELCKLVWLWHVGERMRVFSRELREPLRQMKSQYAAQAHDYGHEFNQVFRDARDILVKHTGHIENIGEEELYQQTLKLPLTWLKAPVDYH